MAVATESFRIVDYKAVELRDAWKRPGCTDLCHRMRGIIVGQFGTSWIEYHDIAGHEQYGVSLGALQSCVVEDVFTGPLVVRLLTHTVLVDGQEVTVTPKEFRILSTLAVRAGRLVPHDTLLAEAWGAHYVLTTGAHDGWHLIRVNVSRLRARLGAAARLIVTRPGVGYMLLAEPYTGPSL